MNLDPARQVPGHRVSPHGRGIYAEEHAGLLVREQVIRMFLARLDHRRHWDALDIRVHLLGVVKAHPALALVDALNPFLEAVANPPPPGVQG
ncbi:hypothetical protein [Streptomyces sp. MJP52]|uniref:hypothetical protein n=1 Tax=Streptomyces sp. MJP52 TaxID=2940555 RepID=UPI00247481B1|nr:hypothetical protein [Streptomyces sp. MJP52]MDH6223634.1 hypothetical protein [Streptomyces sp. MJP52]